MWFRLVDSGIVVHVVPSFLSHINTVSGFNPTVPQLHVTSPRGKPTHHSSCLYIPARLLRFVTVCPLLRQLLWPSPKCRWSHVWTSHDQWLYHVIQPALPTLVSSPDPTSARVGSGDETIPTQTAHRTTRELQVILSPPSFPIIPAASI